MTYVAYSPESRLFDPLDEAASPRDGGSGLGGCAGLGGI